MRNNERNVRVAPYFKARLASLALPLLMGALALATACKSKSPTPPEAVAVDEVKITDGDANSSLSLRPGEIKQLTAEISPGNATVKDVSWSSNAKDVATITVGGLIYAVKDGNATITVTTQDGSKTSNLTVVIAPNPVTEVKIKDGDAYVTSLTLAPGGTKQLTAEVLPENASQKAVSWTSSDEAIAEISQNGLLTAKSDGTATITVTTQDGSKMTSLTVTVKAVPVEDVKIKDGNTYLSSLILKVNDTKPLAAEVLPDNAANKSVVWSSSDTNVATVGSIGFVTAVGEGTTIITVTTIDGNKSASLTVTVEAATGPSIILIKTEQELRDMSKDLDASYQLANDITLTRDWDPIGGLGTPFTGTLDGAGYTIRNFSSVIPTAEAVGLIGVNSGTITNIGIEVSSAGITGKSWVGALAGFNARGRVSGTVTGSGTITLTEDGPLNGVGGLVGTNTQGTVIGYASVTISSKGSNAGGLVGNNTAGTVLGYATGDVSSDIDYIGGLVGNNTSGVSVIGYFTSGTVAGKTQSNVGGLVGNIGGILTGYSRGMVSVNSGVNDAGRIAGGSGIAASASFNVYYSGKTGESSVTGGTPNSFGTSISITTATTAADFAGFDFTNDWEFVSGNWPAIRFPADQSIFDNYRGDKQPIAP